MKLYFAPGSRAVRTAWLLEEIGLDYELERFTLGDKAMRAPDYLAKNPQGLVPTLETEEGSFLTQSLAIMEWLEDTHPEPAILPADPEGRARVRALSYMVACEIHPLNNLRVLFRLRDQFGADEEAQKAWFTHWVTTTFDALETALATSAKTGTFCHGNTPTMADCCLYAQVWNNRRFGIPLDVWPTISRIYGALDTLPVFTRAAPPNQPDAA